MIHFWNYLRSSVKSQEPKEEDKSSESCQWDWVSWHVNGATIVGESEIKVCLPTRRLLAQASFALSILNIWIIKCQLSRSICIVIYLKTRELPGKCSGATIWCYFTKNRCCCKKCYFLLLSNLLILALTPFTFWTPTPRERHISKKLDVKTFPISRSISGTQRCNGRKSRLSKLLSFVPNQRLREYLLLCRNFGDVSDVKKSMSVGVLGF